MRPHGAPHPVVALERPGTAVVALSEDAHVTAATRVRVLRDDPDRYASFHTTAARLRFERSRAAAYHALARAGRPEARLAPSCPGRPPAVRRPAGTWLSIAHTAGLVVALAGVRGPAGVDVERRDRDLGAHGLPARFCSPSERAALGRLPPSARAACLLDLWLAKEALTKAAGTGLAHGFDRISLDVCQDGSVRHPALGWADVGLHRVCATRPPAPLP
ncbi:hypothetical protein GCM10027059_49570 [Myceligenerans halotolerans]